MHLLTLTRLMGDRQYPHSLQVIPTLPMGEKLLLLELTLAINRGREPTRCATSRGRRLEFLMGRFNRRRTRATILLTIKTVGAIPKTTLPTLSGREELLSHLVRPRRNPQQEQIISKEMLRCRCRLLVGLQRGEEL